jgi:hypothetical protein
LWNCGSFTEKFSEKVRNHRKRLDLYPAINIHPLIDLHPVIGENTLASHPSDGFLHFYFFFYKKGGTKCHRSTHSTHAWLTLCTQNSTKATHENQHKRSFCHSSF